MEQERKKHWDTVYETKSPEQVSWTQAKPQTSLNFINSFGVKKSDPIIDIGGGDSRLVDFLLEEGYENITVLDISGKSLQKAKERLGDKASRVTWVESDVTDFRPLIKYAVWHDRAAFHFLTSEEQISDYLKIAEKAVTGFLIIGTFSDQGPEKCSGLHIKQYDEKSMTAVFNVFEKIECKIEDHTTPFGTIQNFVFCGFKKKKLRYSETTR
jgi:hypothetical protein